MAESPDVETRARDGNGSGHQLFDFRSQKCSIFRFTHVFLHLDDRGFYRTIVVELWSILALPCTRIVAVVPGVIAFSERAQREAEPPRFRGAPKTLLT
jgi:hypothetical protein